MTISRDYQIVMEVLTAYVREKAPRGNGEQQFKPREANGNQTKKEELTTKLATDIQAVLTVIARRPYEVRETGYQLDLQRTDLRNADLKEANLSQVFLHGADLSGADLRGASGIKNLLEALSTQGSSVFGRPFYIVDFSEAILDQANFSGANLLAANLQGADLSKANGLTWEQISKATIDQYTKLPPEFEAKKQEMLEQYRKQSETSQK